MMPLTYPTFLKQRAYGRLYKILQPALASYLKYSEDQPREPAGSPEGGQFGPGGGEGSGQDAPRAVSSDSVDADTLRNDKERIQRWTGASGDPEYVAMRQPATEHGKVFTATLARMEQDDGVAYRGHTMKASDLDAAYPIGKNLKFNMHSSSSKSRKVATSFMASGLKTGKTRVMLKIDGGPKADIAKYAAATFKSEREVVVRAGTQYYIVGRKERELPGGWKTIRYTEVHLRYVGGP